jgi:hypothetical protein
VNVSFGFHVVWGALVGTGKGVGCAAVGVGKGATSFLGIYPPTVSNGPPSANSVLRPVNGAYKIGAPAMAVRLSKAGPVGRLAADLIPGIGDFLVFAQGSVAVYDGGKAAQDCVSKIQF